MELSSNLLMGRHGKIKEDIFAQEREQEQGHQRFNRVEETAPAHPINGTEKRAKNDQDVK